MKKICQEALMAQSNDNHRMFLEGLRETTNILIQDNLCVPAETVTKFCLKYEGLQFISQVARYRPVYNTNCAS
jgi:hypothetical protein